MTPSDVNRVEPESLAESLWCRRVHKGRAGPQTSQRQAWLRGQDPARALLSSCLHFRPGLFLRDIPFSTYRVTPHTNLRAGGGAPKHRAQPATVAPSSYSMRGRACCSLTRPSSLCIPPKLEKHQLQPALRRSSFGVSHSSVPFSGLPGETPSGASSLGASGEACSQ